MIRSVRLKNFRCFDDHLIEVAPKTLLVGKNNAGKSTCIEALRLISLVSERLQNFAIKNPPEWSGLPLRAKGVSPSTKNIDLHRSSFFHNYGGPPALVSAIFQNNSRLDVHIGPDFSIHAVVHEPDGEIAHTRTRIAAAGIPRVSISPQISPLQETEGRLNPEYVKANWQSARASLHFRNQLDLFNGSFPAFRELVEASWPGVRVEDLQVPRPGVASDGFGLIVRDGPFAAEIAWMGHGLQMWLQTMWFLTRTRESAVLILDEPDVYMHADLQRSLVRMLKCDPRQFIIATHSAEMMAEVEPDSIVVLDKGKKKSRPATSSRVVQKLLQSFGSVHNLNLARLASQRRILLVEGDDISALKRFQNVIEPGAVRPIDIVPHTDIGGWSGWPSVVTMARFFRDNNIDDFKIACVLDRDYHTDDEVLKRLLEARGLQVALTIWTAKELENYALVPSVIARVISARALTEVTAEEVKTILKEIVAARKDETFDSFAETFRMMNPRGGSGEANKAARPLFDARWRIADGVFAVHGKAIFSDMAGWVQKRYKISISVAAVIAEMRPHEVHKDVATFIREVTSLPSHRNS